ncbi:MAG: hypothetical protein ACFCU8_06380 [Thermosynechococcaceae cyanobacterium]
MTQSDTKRNTQPIELLKSGQLLALSKDEPAGLILQKPFHAEFVGPGAAVGGMFDVQCVTIHTLGKAEFTVPENKEERQVAFNQRLEDISLIQTLCDEVPLKRAIALLELFREKQFALDEIQTIPNEVLAKLVGVLPSTFEMAWQQQLGPALSNQPAAFEEYAVA